MEKRAVLPLTVAGLMIIIGAIYWYLRIESLSKLPKKKVVRRKKQKE